MKTSVSDARVWFLASGTKKVGPLSEARVLERMAEGKVSPRVKAWKEGMEEWAPVGSIPEFAPAASTLVLAPAEERPAAEEKPAPRKRLIERPRRAVQEAFRQPHRIERDDLWRAFELGFELPRIHVALGAMGAVLGCALLAGLAAWIQPILGALAVVIAAPASLVAVALALGASSWQTRRALETGVTPPAGEAFAFARGHAAALVLSPLAVSALAALPPIALVLKSLLSRIPSIGPAVGGISFGIDLALSILSLFLVVAASFAWRLVPSIVAFEETGVGGTVRTLLATVRSRFPRLVLWPRRPAMALSGLALGLALLAALVALVPAILEAPALGIDASALKDKTQLMAFQPSVGLVGIAVWTAALAALVVAIVASTRTALSSLLYVACRAGNDDLITRDDWLAQRQGGIHGSN